MERSPKILAQRGKWQGEQVERAPKQLSEGGISLPEGPDDPRTLQAALRLLQVPKSHKTTYLSALQGKSRKAGVKAFCLECVGWSTEEVRRCTALACPLWAMRPYRTPAKGAR